MVLRLVSFLAEAGADDEKEEENEENEEKGLASRPGIRSSAENRPL